MKLELEDYIIICMVIIIIYILFKKHIIRFGNTDYDSIANTYINNLFKADLNSIINLGTILNNLQTQNENIYDTTGEGDQKITNVIVHNYNSDNMMTCIGPLNIEGGNFIIKNINDLTTSFNIYPRYMIVIWNNTIIPKGWAICDGSTWYVNLETSEFTQEENTEYDKVIVPDLRGRFIYGADSTANSDYAPNKKGGEENVTLTKTDIPSHFHSLPFHMKTGSRKVNKQDEHNLEIIGDSILGGPPALDYDFSNHLYKSDAYFTAEDISITNSWKVKYNFEYASECNVKGAFKTANGYPVLTDYSRADKSDYVPVSKNEPHNNMPPYYVLYYIMKL